MLYIANKQLHVDNHSDVKPHVAWQLSAKVKAESKMNPS